MLQKESLKSLEGILSREFGLQPNSEELFSIGENLVAYFELISKADNVYVKSRFQSGIKESRREGEKK